MPLFEPATIIVQEDDTTVAAAATTIDFTEPLGVDVVTESPTGEANINLALYFLASALRPVTGAILSVDASNVLEASNTGDTIARLGITHSTLQFGPGAVTARDVGISRASAGLGEFLGDWRFTSNKKLIFRDTDNTAQTTIAAGNQLTDIDYTWPQTGAQTNQVMKCSSAGVMTWASLLTVKGGFTSGSVIFANSSGDLAQDNANLFWDDTANRLGIGVTSPASRLELEEVTTLSAGLGDGIAAMLHLDPGYTGGFTVTRHNYIKCEDVSVAASAVVTDACSMWFDAAAGTHKALDAGTTKVSIGVVTAWEKKNINGTVHFSPLYSSKTS